MRPWQSFRRKYPLILFALVCVVVVAVSTSAYRSLRGVLLASEEARIVRSSAELGRLLEQVARRARRDAAELSAQEDVRAALESWDSVRQTRARQVVERLLVQSPQLMGLTLEDRSGIRIASAGSPATDSAVSVRGRGRIGRIRARDRDVAFRVTEPVVAGGDTIGFISLHRRVSRWTGRMQEVLDFRSTLALGNVGDSVWSDFSGPMAGPPRATARLGEALRYVANDTAYVGVMRAIPGTPWLLTTQTAQRAALAPARQLLVEMFWIGAVVLLIAALLVWALAYRMTKPLAELTQAAEEMARGEFHRRVSSTRTDELGSLAHSFNAMADWVQDATGSLAEQAERLRSSERHFRALIEHASDMICVLDLEGRQRYASPAHERFIGFTSAELEGVLAFDYVHPDDVPLTLKTFQAVCARPGERFAVRFRYRHKNGTWRNFSSIATNLLDDPDVRGIVVNSYDVTEQAELEAQLLQSQKMEAVGQLAGGVAHDFNNLLTVITSYSGILLEELPADAKMREEISEISRAADRAASLVGQLLAFSRQQVLRPQVLDLNDVIGGITRMLERVLPEHVRLDTALAPELGHVNADPGQVEQVLVNLVVNARDAMPDGGTITIASADTELGHDYARQRPDVVPGRYVMLAVSDTGIGMDASTHSRIFDPFFTTKDVGKGTGLGLAMVYGIVRQSGGHIEVTTEPGRGSTFRVYLPRVAEADVDAGTRQLVAGISRGRGSILLVEDEVAVRQVARRVLESAGYEVHEAGSGTEALEAWKRNGGAFELLLTDMVMPEMGGRELADRLRRECDQLRVVFMSGYTEDALLREGGGAEPGQAFVQKPFTPKTLTDAIRGALQPAGWPA
jgi:two-component system, cell cycle sensor histidine kinase and response regulator CckA